MSRDHKIYRSLSPSDHTFRDYKKYRSLSICQRINILPYDWGV